MVINWLLVDSKVELMGNAENLWPKSSKIHVPQARRLTLCEKWDSRTFVADRLVHLHGAFYVRMPDSQASWRVPWNGHPGKAYEGIRRSSV